MCPYDTRAAIPASSATLAVVVRSISLALAEFR
jgi:hypothetical protein